MAFRCPMCQTPDSLLISRSLDLPPDSRSDEIALQIVCCSQCGFEGLAVYEESRRGVLDSESWDHTGYRAAAKDLADLRKGIAACPLPKDPGCKCPAHQKYGRRDATGRWDGLCWVDIAGSFPLQQFAGEAAG